MVIIRLSRKGVKKRPFYQIIVSDNRNSRDGKFIERLGFLNPIKNVKTKNLNISLERINYWINQGAKISKRVLTLIKYAKKY